MSPTIGTESRREWLTQGEKATHSELDTGCLQRIATALESMAKGWTALEQDRDYYKREYQAERVRSAHLRNQIRGLKGTITRKWRNGVERRP